MEDKMRTSGLAQWTLILMPVIPVLFFLPQYQALWVVLLAYVLGTLPIWSSVIRQAGTAFMSRHANRSPSESATVLACVPPETLGTA